MKQIPLSGGKYFALVDDEDYESLIKWNWCYHKGGYATRNIRNAGKQSLVFMHREILQTPADKLTDHIDHNGFNNQRANLRIVTRQQNNRNILKTKSKTSSQYKGVSWDNRKNKWAADIKTNSKGHHIGYFKNEQHAALAYDLWAVHLFGEYAHTNFPIMFHS